MFSELRHRVVVLVFISVVIILRAGACLARLFFSPGNCFRCLRGPFVVLCCRLKTCLNATFVQNPLCLSGNGHCFCLTPLGAHAEFCHARKTLHATLSQKHAASFMRSGAQNLGLLRFDVKPPFTPLLAPQAFETYLFVFDEAFPVLRSSFPVNNPALLHSGRA